MATQTNNPGKAIQVLVGGVAILAYRLVKFNGQYTAADATQDWVGVSQEPRNPGEYAPVRFTKAGTVILTAAVAIAAGQTVYKDANGMVGLTNTNARVGIALTAAAGINDQFEVLT